MKKLICLCLVVLLCFSIASPAFASQNDTFSTKIRAIAHSHGVSSASLQAQAVLDQNSFKRLGYDSSVITPCDLNKDSNIVYEIMFGDVVNQIAIRTDTNRAESSLHALAMISGLLHLSFPLLPIQTILTITKETLYLGVSAH